MWNDPFNSQSKVGKCRLSFAFFLWSNKPFSSLNEVDECSWVSPVCFFFCIYFIYLLITKLQHRENKQKEKVQRKYSSTTKKKKKKTRAITERSLSTISQIQDLQIFQNIFWYLTIRGKETIDIKGYNYKEQSVRKFHFLASPAFFSIIDLDLTRCRKFAKLGDISSILACQI